jgi:urea-proton symporter
VSSWTWSATLLQSSNVTYQYGISGAFWYAAGASIQLLLFGLLARRVKHIAKNCHTIGEVVYARWGPLAHKVFLYVMVLTNVLVVSMLITGGASVITKITGLDIGSASFFVRLFFYTGTAGIMACYSAAYIHTAIVYLIMFFFVFGTIGDSSNSIGGMSGMYDRLTQIPLQTNEDCTTFGYNPATQICGGLSGNLDGSYLTLWSKKGFMFGMINLVGNFGAVFMDQTYWHTAIATEEKSTCRSYILAGLCWLAIPLSMGISMGLSTVALQLPTNIDEANNGLVPVSSAISLYGNAGALLILIQVVMAVSAAGSAELNAIASLFVYDIYRTYFNPFLTGDEVKFYSRLSIITTGSIMGACSVLVQNLNISLNWIYLFMGVCISSGVVPLTCCIYSKYTKARAAIVGTLGGQLLAIMVWLSAAKIQYGEITIDTTGEDDVMLIGNLTALLSSTALVLVMSYLDPDNFDFSTLNDKITLIEDDKMSIIHISETESLISRSSIIHTTTTNHAGRMSNVLATSTNPIHSSGPSTSTIEDEVECTRMSTTTTSTNGASVKQETVLALALVVVILLLWPLLTLPMYTFDHAYFNFYLLVMLCFTLCSTIVILLLPLVEAKEELVRTVRGLWSERDVYSTFFGNADGSSERGRVTNHGIQLKTIPSGGDSSNSNSNSSTSSSTSNRSSTQSSS